MASTNGVIFPESMVDILGNPVDICFGSMPATSTAPAACLVIEGNTVTTNQQIETDLPSETHPPAPSDLIAGIHHVESILSDTIKICEHVKRPRTTSSTSSMPLGLRNAAHVASRYMKRRSRLNFDPTPKIVETAGITSTNPALFTRSPSTPHTSAVCSRSFVDRSPRLTVAG
jgi:hypothetical protein